MQVAYSRSLSIALFCFLSLLPALASPTSERKEVHLGKVEAWEVTYSSSNEQPSGSCIALRFTERSIHILGIGGLSGDWVWHIRPLDSQTVSRGDNGQSLKFIFDEKLTNELDAAVLGGHTIRAYGLTPDLLRAIANSDRLRLELDGKSLDELALKGTSRLIATLEKCYTDRVLEAQQPIRDNGAKHEELDRLHRETERLMQEGDYLRATTIATKALVLAEETFGTEHAETSFQLNSLGLLLYYQGQYDEAEPLHERALAIREKALGYDHPDVATSLNNLAELYRQQARYAEAEPLYERALAILEKALGREHPDVAMILNNLAELHREQARYDEAEPLHERALAIREKALGYDHPDVAMSLNNLAELYRQQARYAEPEPLYERSLEILEKALGPEHPDVATRLNNLAEFYSDQARYAEAEPLYERSLEILEKALGREHPDVATILNNLALLYSSQARYEIAEPLYERVLAIDEKALGPEHPDLAVSLNNLAELYRQQARYAEAEPLYERVLEIVEKAFGPEHPYVAISLNNLAVRYAEQGRYDEAEPLHERAVAIREKALGSDHPDVAVSLDSLAELYRQQARYAEPEPLYERALAISEKALGPEHPYVATSLNNLAGLYAEQGRYAEAEPLHERALAIREKALGSDHPAVAMSLDNLAVLYSAQGKPELELPLRRRVQRIDASRLTQGLIGEQGEGTSNQRAHSLGYLQLLSGLDQANAEDRADALTAVQLARHAERGEAFRLLAQRLAAGGSGELAALVRERQDLIHQLDALEKRLIEAVGAPAEQRIEGLSERLRTQIDGLRQQERAISERLQRQFPAYVEFEGARLADLRSLQEALRPGEAALAWVLGDEKSYLLIAPETGDLRLKTLAVTADEAAEQVQQLHRALDLGNPDHEGELAPFPAKVAFELFEALFGPEWQTDLTGVQRLLLVPEGPLTRLSFPILLTETPEQAEFAASSGKYAHAPWLVRRFAVSVLPSLSSLTVLRRLEQEGQAAKPFLGVGDPLLDDAPARTRGVEPLPTDELALLRNLRGIAGIQPPPASPAEVRRVRLERIRQLSPLPDTAVELKRIARLLGAGDEDLLLREAATEQRVKHFPLDDYGIVSFATHGVLAGELGLGIEPGLILTPPDEATADDDGFLALSEVAQLKLNADWVVLSACNTGSSAAAERDEATGEAEGLTGLANAFSYAGTKALLVSHWAVGSDATGKLMERLFRGYRERQLPRAEAHRQAMLAMIEDEKPLFRHPSFWAPFVVVGDGG